MPSLQECGLHSGNIKKADGTTEERKADRDLWIDGKVGRSGTCLMNGI